MNSFGKIFLFEIKYRLQRWDTYIYFLAFFIFCFYSIHSSGIFTNYGGAGQRVYANSSNTIGFFISRMSIWLIAISAALMSVPIVRDRETKTTHYYYALPISKPGYLFGRYLGTLVILGLISTAVLLGIGAGYMVPGHDPATLQPYRMLYFLQPFATLILFNLLISSLIFFSMVNLTRHVLGGYMTAVIIIALHMISSRFFDLQDLRLFTLMDPYGDHAFMMSTWGWSILQRNTKVVPLESWLLYNRLIWLGVGALLFIISYWKFSFTGWMQEKQTRGKTKDAPLAGGATVKIPAVRRIFNFRCHLRHFFQQTWLELRYHLKTIFFIVMISAAGFILFYDALSVYNPTVSRMLEIKEGYFSIFALVILVFFAGEAVNRERELKLAHITDTLPVPNWLFTGSKLLSIIAIGFLLSTLILAAIIYTLWHKDVPDINWGAYLIECYLIVFPYYALLAVLAFGIQVLVKNKFVGHTLMILFFILNIIAKSLGIEHNLLFYAAPPKPLTGPLASWAGYSIDYSEMNGYEPFAAGRTWFSLYWFLFALLLLVLVNAMWKRGIELHIGERLRAMGKRLNMPAKISLLLFGAGFIASGSYIFYNTNILNEYLPQTSRVPLERMATFEKQYKHYSRKPLPWITHVGLSAELYPDRRRVEMTVRYKTENRSGKPVDTLFVTLPKQFSLQRFSVKGAETDNFLHDDALGFYACRLPETMQPGDRQEILLEGVIQLNGFLNETTSEQARFSSRYMYLGTFDLPILGYDDRREIPSEALRADFGLPPRNGLHNMEDSMALKKNVWSPVSDWVSLDVTIGTKNTHTAIAPGNLLREWENNGRRYFHYSTGENRHPYGLEIYSGIFSELKQVWTSADQKDTVNLELYCYEKHTSNADSVFSISKWYLNYLAASGGKYPGRVLRYVEMPYGLGNLSENNLLSRFSGEGAYPNFMDYRVANITLAGHFGNALAPAAVSGAGVYSTISSYFSQSGIQAKYPAYAYSRKYNNAVTEYLAGRGGEKSQERPVYNCFGWPYMSSKTGVAIGNLRYMIGDEKLQAHLQAFRDQHGWQGPPYLVSTDLLDYLRARIPDSLHHKFDETFYKIVLYKNRIRKAHVTALASNRYRIDVEAEKHKIQDDGLGNEKPVKDEEYVEIGVHTSRVPPESPLPDLITSVKLKEGLNRFSIYTDAPPVKVTIDPHYLLMNQLLLNGKNEQTKKTDL